MTIFLAGTNQNLMLKNTILKGINKKKKKNKDEESQPVCARNEYDSTINIYIYSKTCVISYACMSITRAMSQQDEDDDQHHREEDE